MDGKDVLGTQTRQHWDGRVIGQNNSREKPYGEERHFIMIKHIIYNKAPTVRKIYVPNNAAPNYKRKNYSKSKEKQKHNSSKMI